MDKVLDILELIYQSSPFHFSMKTWFCFKEGGGDVEHDFMYALLAKNAIHNVQMKVKYMTYYSCAFTWGEGRGSEGQS